MADDKLTRTEEPTPKRLEEARAEGQVAQSIEVTSAVVLLAALVTLVQRGGSALSSLREMMRSSLLSASPSDLTPGEAVDLVRRMTADASLIVVPVVIAAALSGLVVTLAQVGFMVVPKRVLPDLKRISFASGFERMFSRRGVMELVKAVLKICLIGWIGWKLVRAAEPRIVPIAFAQVREILAVAGDELRRMVTWALGVLAVIAAADYFWQRREHHQSLRMTRAEVKDERKQAEGDPQVRNRIKRAYQQLSKRRMLADVPTADVVVTNPVHVAVALRYAPGEMGAPKVVAKGAEHVAERIKEIARRYGVPIVERRALARALFRTVPIGREIPATLYRAVAEILAYIYSLGQRRAG